MSLRNHNWITFGGAPVTGMAPTRTVVNAQTPGTVMTAAQQGFVAHAYKLFCDAINVSTFPNGYHLQNRVAPDGMKVRMESNAGVHRVWVWLPAAPDEPVEVLPSGIGVCFTKIDNTLIPTLTIEREEDGVPVFEPQPLILRPTDKTGKNWRVKRVPRLMGGNVLWSNGRKWFSIFGALSNQTPLALHKPTLATGGGFVPRYNLDWSPNFSDDGVARYAVNNTVAPQSQQWSRYIYTNNETAKLAPTLDVGHPPFVPSGSPYLVQLDAGFDRVYVRLTTKTIYKDLEVAANQPANTKTGNVGNQTVMMPANVTLRETPRASRDGKRLLAMVNDSNVSDNHNYTIINVADIAARTPENLFSTPLVTFSQVARPPVETDPSTSVYSSFAEITRGEQGPDAVGMGGSGDPTQYYWALTRELSQTDTLDYSYEQLNRVYFVDTPEGEQVFEEKYVTSQDGSFSRVMTSASTLLMPVSFVPTETWWQTLAPNIGDTQTETSSYSYTRTESLSTPFGNLTLSTETSSGSGTASKSGAVTTKSMSWETTHARGVVIFGDHVSGAYVVARLTMSCTATQTDDNTPVVSAVTKSPIELVFYHRGVEQFVVPITYTYSATGGFLFSGGAYFLELRVRMLSAASATSYVEEAEYGSVTVTTPDPTALNDAMTKYYGLSVDSSLTLLQQQSLFQVQFARDPKHKEVLIFSVQSKQTTAEFSRVYAVGDKGIFPLKDVTNLSLPVDAKLWEDHNYSSLVSI